MSGFSDKRLAVLSNKSEIAIRKFRLNNNITAVFKRIDTCAAEFEAQTPYMYSTYETPAMGEVECEARPSQKKKIIILGGGPNRIGQGIEFDYCCCHACFSLSSDGYETIMINCNPETVSTDYDTSDRLYFEPLTLEHVLEIIRVEQSNGSLHGVIVQFGGQTPLNLAQGLADAGIPILGTSPDAIDLAEDRERFQALVVSLKLKQPRNGIAHTKTEAINISLEIGFPLVIRPSYVLGGRAMEIVHNSVQLERYISETVILSGDSPVLLDSYLSNAIEVDIDAISDGSDVHVAGIMQHIEEAGVHSGDSACSLPPYSLSPNIITELSEQTKKLALALEVVGLMNVQFAVKDNQVYLIEVNPRASRTVPFVAKAVGSPIASISAQVMAGRKLSEFKLVNPIIDGFCVKEVVLPFARFPGVDTLLGPEMRSTGEVMGSDRSFHRAFLKAQIGAGNDLPRKAVGKIFISIKDSDKTEAFLKAIVALEQLGHSIIATRGTATWLQKSGLKIEVVNKVYEGRPNIVDQMKDKKISLVFNTTVNSQAVEDSREIRAVALYDKIPYFTTAAASEAAALSMKSREEGEFSVTSIQSKINTSK